MQPAEKPALYDRLGGVYSIATVVDDFISRIMVDPRLNANPLVTKRTIACRRGLQVPGDRDGLLGYWRSAKIHGPVDGELSCPLEDYQREWRHSCTILSKHWISSRFPPRSKLN